MSEEPDYEYGHHPEGYDPRGPDWDAPNTPEREMHMQLRRSREDAPAPVPCPVCGEVHSRE